jgi:hypothetical protein
MIGSIIEGFLNAVSFLILFLLFFILLAVLFSFWKTVLIIAGFLLFMLFLILFFKQKIDINKYQNGRLYLISGSVSVFSGIIFLILFTLGVFHDMYLYWFLFIGIMFSVLGIIHFRIYKRLKNEKRL